MKIPLINHIIAYCKIAQHFLKQSSNFGEDFCRYKQHFFTKYQRGIVFSTRFGADFFDCIIELLQKRALIPSNGEYDNNINKWLEMVYAD
jgi:hypothetical protein